MIASIYLMSSARCSATDGFAEVRQRATAQSTYGAGCGKPHTPLFPTHLYAAPSPRTLVLPSSHLLRSRTESRGPTQGAPYSYVAQPRLTRLWPNHFGQSTLCRITRTIESSDEGWSACLGQLRQATETTRVSGCRGEGNTYHSYFSGVPAPMWEGAANGIMRFHLVDRIVTFEAGKLLQAVKHLTLAEEFLTDHFPTFPVMPGVLQLQALVEAGSWPVALGRRALPTVFGCCLGSKERQIWHVRVAWPPLGGGAWRTGVLARRATLRR